jgi:hypothetical protein
LQIGPIAEIEPGQQDRQGEQESCSATHRRPLIQAHRRARKFGFGSHGCAIELRTMPSAKLISAVSRLLGFKSLRRPHPSAHLRQSSGGEKRSTQFSGNKSRNVPGLAIHQSPVSLRVTLPIRTRNGASGRR